MNFEITKREVLASISIIAVMIMIGIFISNKISEHQMDENEQYNKAVKINSQELLQYGMDTNVGNAFVYGELKAVDTVTYPELGGEYMYVKKVKEIYTQHTRTVTTVDGNGRTHTTTQTYWSWDAVSSEDIKCKEITFCGVKFPSNKVALPSKKYINTVNESYYVRYNYYGIGTSYTGTIYTKLMNGTISDNSRFFNGSNIEETIDYLKSGVGNVIFWIIWIIATIALVYGFYYLGNGWLE